jgi:hypothetical protein
MATTTPPAQPVHSAASDTSDTYKELAVKLERFLVLQELAGEYEKLKKELKPVFKGTPSVEIGDFEVTGSFVTMPPRNMPEVTYWNMKVERKQAYTLEIGQKGGADAVAGE